MKKNLKGYLPVIIIGLASLLLIGLFYYYHSVLPRPDHRQFAGTRHERIPGREIFNQIGNGAILAGALSFSWYLFKKKLKSPFKIVKMLGKKAHKIHEFVGWSALVLVAVHGGYYLIKDFNNLNNLTGAAAFLLLLGLAVYGYILKRKKKKALRSAHFILSILWIGALLIHGGGFVIGCGIGMAAVYMGVTWLERKTKRIHKEKTSEKSVAL